MSQYPYDQYAQYSQYAQYGNPYQQYANQYPPNAAYGQTSATQYSSASSAYPATITAQTYNYAQPAVAAAAQMQQMNYMPQIRPPVSSPSGVVPTNSLWMGDIDAWMDENYIYSLFSHTGEITSVKLIRDKQTARPAGYGFVYFTTPVAAQKVLENFNNQPIPGTSKVFRLNWAQHGASTAKNPGARGVPAPPSGDAISVFVGDLASNVTEAELMNTFRYYYPSVYSSKIVRDANTGMSKGYGFVYFGREDEKQRSLTEMQGMQISYRPIKVNVASKKTSSPAIGPQIPMREQKPTLSPSDPNNTTVFVGGIDPSVTHEVLRAFFEPYGQIVGVKIPANKGCGFVEFASHDEAAQVLNSLSGNVIIGNSQVRLAWGRPTVAPPVTTPAPVPQPSQPPPPSQPYPDGSQPYDPSETYNPDASSDSEAPYPPADATYTVSADATAPYYSYTNEAYAQPDSSAAPQEAPESSETVPPATETPAVETAETSETSETVPAESAETSTSQTETPKATESVPVPTPSQTSSETISHKRSLDEAEDIPPLAESPLPKKLKTEETEETKETETPETQTETKVEIETKTETETETETETKTPSANEIV